MDEFHREYFIQTRQEIDTIKREMNQFLYFSVFIVGAIGFAIARGDNAQEFFAQPWALATEIATLAIVTSLFWLRRLNLQQIADRWFVLRRIVHRHFPSTKVEEMMEGLVCKRLERSTTYTKQEYILNLAISAPVYGLLTVTGLKGFGLAWQWGLAVAWTIAVAHVIASAFLLRHREPLRNHIPKMEDAEPPSYSERQADTRCGSLRRSDGGDAAEGSRQNMTEDRREFLLERYRQKYEVFRHFDTLRWQIPTFTIAAGAVLIGLSAGKDQFPPRWSYVIFGVLSVFSSFAIFRVRNGIAKNHESLAAIAKEIGDSIPDREKRGATWWLAVIQLIIGIVAITVSLF